jgi:23S rRNA pseudouridine1911/1915/1917 synthase
MFTVADTERGQRLDRFLQTQLPDRSRAFLQKLIEDAHVRVNGQPNKASYKVRVGDVVTVEIPPPMPLAARPEEIRLAVLFEDADLIVVNKAPGMVVHPAAGNYEHTLVNALLHHCRGQLSGIGGVERPGIVHRLDKGTSGCIVVAKTDAAHQSLVEQFKSRTVRKIYRAICWGTFARPTGRIETEIGRSEHDRQKMSARVTRGRAALSEYKVLKQFAGGPRSVVAESGERTRQSASLHAPYALVEVTPHTGRTHQIRVHMAHIGHPLVGDAVYGRRQNVVAASLLADSWSASKSADREQARGYSSRQPTVAAEIAVDRPLLHAYKLSLTHPRTGERMEFEAPVPEDMANLCNP